MPPIAIQGSLWAVLSTVPISKVASFPNTKTVDALKSKNLTGQLYEHETEQTHAKNPPRWWNTTRYDIFDEISKPRLITSRNQIRVREHQASKQVSYIGLDSLTSLVTNTFHSRSRVKDTKVREKCPDRPDKSAKDDFGCKVGSQPFTRSATN